MSTWRDQYDALVAQVKDTRVYKEQDVAAVLLFGFHMVDFLHGKHIEYRGHNMSNKGWCYLLVVKVTIADTPLVVFISERDPISCMRIFIRQVEEDRVKWVEDKYA
jgi:hypothetical protein